jgi:hypothetical protein
MVLGVVWKRGEGRENVVLGRKTGLFTVFLGVKAGC